MGERDTLRKTAGRKSGAGTQSEDLSRATERMQQLETMTAAMAWNGGLGFAFVKRQNQPMKSEYKRDKSHVLTVRFVLQRLGCGLIHKAASVWQYMWRLCRPGIHQFPISVFQHLCASHYNNTVEHAHYSHGNS